MIKKQPTLAIPPDGCASYLTAGKEYPIKFIKSADGGYSDSLFTIIDDKGYELLCSKSYSAHLDFKNWILK